MDAFQKNPNMMQHGQEAKAAFQKALHLLKQHKSPSFLQEVGVRCHLGVGTILRNGTERNGTERNDGLNHGTERFLKLKLATYHC